MKILNLGILLVLTLAGCYAGGQFQNSSELAFDENTPIHEVILRDSTHVVFDDYDAAYYNGTRLVVGTDTSGVLWSIATDRISSFSNRLRSTPFLAVVWILVTGVGLLLITILLLGSKSFKT